MKRIALLCFYVTSCWAARTTVADTLKLPNGSLYSGNLQISWPVPFIAYDNVVVPSGPPIQVTVKNGVLSVSLEPTASTVSPTSGLYYSVSYRPAGQGAINEIWLVPISASPVGLATVRVQQTPGQVYTTVATSLLTGTLQAAQEPAHTGDVTNSSGSLVLSIGAGKVTEAKLGFTDITTANATSSQHGLLPKLSGSATDCFTGAGTFVACGAAGGAVLGGGNLTTVGAIPYVSSSGVLNQDALNLFWDSTNHRLGVGTNAPLRPLDVRGTSGSSLISIGIAADNGDQIAIRGDNALFTAVDGAAILNSQTGDVYVQTANTNVVIFKVGGNILVGGSGDTGVTRNGAGILEINNGTPGVLRDLTLRNITINGTCSGAGCVGGGISNFSSLLDFGLVKTSATVATLGTGCTSTTPCNVPTGNVLALSLQAAATVTISGTTDSGTAYWYVSSAGVLTVGHNSTATLTCNPNCTVATGITGFPADSTPLWAHPFTSNEWATVTEAMDYRGIGSRQIVVADAVTIQQSINGATGVKTLSVDTTIIPTISAFSTLTDAATVTWAIGSQYTASANLTFTVHTGSRTLNVTGLVNGGTYELFAKQDSTGGVGLLFGTGCTWKVGGGGSGAVTLSSGANQIDKVHFKYDGTNCYVDFSASQKNYN